MKLGVRMS